jgi:hypothetical protein
MTSVHLDTEYEIFRLTNNREIMSYYASFDIDLLTLLLFWI